MVGDFSNLLIGSKAGIAFGPFAAYLRFQYAYLRTGPPLAPIFLLVSSVYVSLVMRFA